MLGNAEPGQDPRGLEKGEAVVRVEGVLLHSYEQDPGLPLEKLIDLNPFIIVDSI